MLSKDLTKAQLEILKVFENTSHNRYARIVEFKKEHNVKSAEELVEKKYLIRIRDYAYIRNPYTPDKMEKDTFIDFVFRYFFKHYPDMLNHPLGNLRLPIHNMSKKEIREIFIMIFHAMTRAYEMKGNRDEYSDALEDAERTLSR